MLATNRLNRSLLGVLSLIAGVTVFSLQDLVLKFISGEYPLHEAMTVRSLVAIPCLLLLLKFEGGIRLLSTPRWKIHLGRGAIMFFAYTFYYLALAALPIATCTAIWFAAPLFITALSVVVLKEQVGWRRWLGIVAGLLGVLIMLRPGSSLFAWASLLPLCAALGYSISMTIARKTGGVDAASAMAFYANLAFCAGALVLTAIFGSGAFATSGDASLGFLTRSWVWPTAFDLGLMMSTGVVAGLGITLLTNAYKVARGSVVAPFEYTAMVWGVLNGWLFFGDWPDATAWLGIAIIIGSGLYVLYRDKVRSASTSSP